MYDPYSGNYYYIDRVPADKGHTSSVQEEWCYTAGNRCASRSACICWDAVQENCHGFVVVRVKSLRARKAYVGMEVFLQSFLTSALDGREW